MGELEGPPKVELCVFCSRHKAESAWRPFCSARCQTQDLARWADGSYRAPGAAVEAEDTGNDDTDADEDAEDENG